MVNFSVFNELSLPLNQHTVKDKFGIFFKLLRELKNKGLGKVRMSTDFKDYQILENTPFGQFLGQQTDTDFKRRLLSFCTNGILEIDSPIVQPSEQEQVKIQNRNEYFYNNCSTSGGLACCDIWNTIAISFNSKAEWSNHNISLQKGSINKNGDIPRNNVDVIHASQGKHLEKHGGFFTKLQKEINKKITRENFWENREKNFPKIIVFCPEVEKEIKNIGKKMFNNAISILRNVEIGDKKITDYSWSRESQSVHQNLKFKNERMFSINGQKRLIENHISITDGGKIYFLEEESKVHIGYIGKHLPTQKYQ